jgi:chaperonin cofactor prefoldin
MIQEIVFRSTHLDRLYIRGVCNTWNQLADRRLPPELLQTLRQLTKLAADVDTIERGIDDLTAQISHLNVVQDNMETLSTAANVMSVGSAVFHGCPIVVKALHEYNEMCEENIRRLREQYPDDDGCSIL